MKASVDAEHHHPHSRAEVGGPARESLRPASTEETRWPPGMELLCFWREPEVKPSGLGCLRPLGSCAHHCTARAAPKDPARSLAQEVSFNRRPSFCQSPSVGRCPSSPVARGMQLMSKFKKMIILHAGVDVGKRVFLNFASEDVN